MGSDRSLGISPNLDCSGPRMNLVIQLVAGPRVSHRSGSPGRRLVAGGLGDLTDDRWAAVAAARPLSK